MKRLRMRGWVCGWMVMTSVLSFADKKMVKIKDCTAEPDKQSVSYHKAKDEHIRWTSVRKPYVVQFKDYVSPCVSDTGTPLLAYLVNPGKESVDCYAPDGTAEGEFPYVIYEQQADGTWKACGDPAVIVTDGGGMAAEKSQGAGTPAKKKTVPKK